MTASGNTPHAVLVSTDPPAAGPAQPIAVMSVGSDAGALGGPALRVVEINDGRGMLGGPPLLVVVASGVQAEQSCAGPAIPVVVVSGSLDTYTHDVQALSPIGYWPGAEPNGLVSLDESGNAYNGAYTGVTLGQPGIGDGRTAGLYVPASNGRNNIYSVALAGAFNGAAGTASQWLQANAWADGATRYGLYLQGATGADKVYIQKSAGGLLNVGYSAGGSDKSMARFSYTPAGFFPVGLTWSATNDATYMYVAGQRVAYQAGIGTWGGGPLVAPVCVIGALTGSTGALSWDGAIAHTALFGSPLNSADMAVLHRAAGHVLCEGDSRTAWQDISWPEQLWPSISLGWWSVGTGGATLADMQSRAAAHIAAYMRPRLAKNVVCILGGLNDALGGASLATIQSRLATLCGTYRAAGFRVIVSTEIDAQSAGANAVGWHTTVRPTLNSWLRTSYAAFADVLIDNGADARLSDATNGTYFAGDAVHPIAAGYAVMAGLFAAGINAL